MTAFLKLKDFLTYVVIPAGFVWVAYLAWRNGHPVIAVLHGLYLAVWLWRYPWFVRLVVRSLLGLEP